MSTFLSDILPRGGVDYDEGWNHSSLREPVKDPCTAEYLQGYIDHAVTKPDIDRASIPFLANGVRVFI